MAKSVVGIIGRPTILSLGAKGEELLWRMVNEHVLRAMQQRVIVRNEF